MHKKVNGNLMNFDFKYRIFCFVFTTINTESTSRKDYQLQTGPKKTPFSLQNNFFFRIKSVCSETIWIRVLSICLRDLYICAIVKVKVCLKHWQFPFPSLL